MMMHINKPGIAPIVPAPFGCVVRSMVTVFSFGAITPAAS